MVLISYNGHCDFTSVGQTWSRGMFPKVRYQSCLFRRDAGWKSTGDAGSRGWKSNRYPTHWKLIYSSTSKAAISLHTCLWIFLNIYTHTKTSQPHSRIINNRVKFPPLELAAMLDAEWNSTKHDEWNLESFDPQWVAGIDLPQPRCCGLFVSLTNKNVFERLPYRPQCNPVPSM